MGLLLLGSGAFFGVLGMQGPHEGMERMDYMFTVWRFGLQICMYIYIYTVNPIKLETGLRPNSAGIPYTLLL